MGHRFAQNRRFVYCASWLFCFEPVVTQVTGARCYSCHRCRIRLYAQGDAVLKTLTVVTVLLMLQGCAAMVVGTAVGVATTVAVETAKVPFKVTGAVIDVATDDDDD